MAGKVNNGYLMPEKGRGKLNINGREGCVLVCEWLSPDKSELSIRVRDGEKSQGSMKPHAKTSPGQPDWRGNLTDDEGKEWWISAWNRDRPDGEIMWGISLTDPATFGQRNGASSGQGTSAPAPAASSPAPAPAAAPAQAASPAPAPDPAQMPPLGNPNDYSLDDIADIFES